MPNVVFPDRDRGDRRATVRLLRHGRLPHRRRRARPQPGTAMTILDPEHRRERSPWRAGRRAHRPCAVTGGRGGAPSSRHRRAARPLTNLAHLDFLTDRSPSPARPGTRTYRLAADPTVGVLWVYADRGADGSFTAGRRRRYDAGDRHSYGQGAYDTDDIARAAVVYLRQWRATGDRDRRKRRPTNCCAA